MLLQLHIKNIALIEEAEIDFGKGLNILSGETGAGKSMVIDSVNFALGERISRDFIRKGEDQAVVEALFIMKDESFMQMLKDTGINAEEDGSVLIKRTINSNGRVLNKVNGSTVTAGMLNKLSEALIDIHGQHEHQSLLNPARHIRLLDQFLSEQLEEKKRRLEQLYKKYRQINKDMEKLNGDERSRVQKMDLLKFQIEEITQAQLKKDEEEELFERKRLLNNSEKINRLSSKALELLFEGAENQSAVDMISEAMDCLEGLSDIDKGAEHVYKAIEGIYAQLDDLIREISKYKNNIEWSPEELDELEERLTLIYNLKRKYGGSIDEIKQYYKEIKIELDFISGSEESLKKLTAEKEELKKELVTLCSEISEIRKNKAYELQQKIEQELKELEMKNASFEINVERKNEFNADGWDKVEFLISANLGEELKPLAKIASGGEMSRVMLALKTVLAGVDNIETFIFDEIDTGVSGRTAQKVAEKMALIGRTHQVLCITHLPQIASMADSHFLIEKIAENQKTTTNVFALNLTQSADEIARLIGGAKITDSTRKAAQEMKSMAEEFKNNKL